MARVTVEDCLKNVNNRFELVILASKRARQLMRGKQNKLPWNNDKPTVLALREIAEGLINMGNVDAVDEPMSNVHEITFVEKIEKQITPATDSSAETDSF